MNKPYTVEYLASAHKHSIFHRTEIINSTVCGCFHCGSIYALDAIKEWVEEAPGKEDTALCPDCGIDAVLSDLSGFEVSSIAFLKAMQRYYFTV